MFSSIDNIFSSSVGIFAVVRAFLCLVRRFFVKNNVEPCSCGRFFRSCGFSRGRASNFL